MRARAGRHAKGFAIAALVTLVAGQATAAVLHGVHGDAVAGGLLVGLLSAGVGFGMAKLIGRQR